MATRHMEDGDKGAAEADTREEKKHQRVSYPWKALIFIMGNAMGQRCVHADQRSLLCRLRHSLSLM